jgi:hypothetical protein
VAVEAPLGVTVRGLVAGQVPDDEGLVARSGEKHVRAGRMSVSRPEMLYVDMVNAHFSRDVARDVTQPEWPSRVPRRTNCSAMFAVCGFCCFDVVVRSGKSSSNRVVDARKSKFRGLVRLVLAPTVRRLAPQLPPRQS